MRTRGQTGTRLSPATRLSRGAITVVAAALVVAGCGTAGGPDGGEPTEVPFDDATPPPSPDTWTAEQIAATTAYETTVGARLTDEGTIPLDLALDLFAGSFGPIGGGDADAVGPAPMSATLAVFGTRAHWGELDEGQRTAVAMAFEDEGGDDTGHGDDAEARGGTARTGTSAHTATGGHTATRRNAVTAAHTATAAASTADLQAIADEVQAEIEVLLGEDLGIPVRVVQREQRDRPDGDPRPSTGPSGGAIPLRGGRWIPDGRADGCRVIVYSPGAAVTAPRGLLRTLLAHEVFHCFQFAAVPDVGEELEPAAWVIEGSAEFVAATIAPGHSHAWWDGWLGDPGQPLFRRSYSAIGVYAVAQQSGADPWETMLPMLRTSSSRAALELLFDTTADVAMRTVAQALVREPILGAGWESVGPGITATRATTDLAAAEGATVERSFDLRRFATGQVTVDVSGPVVDVTVLGGVGRLGLPGGTTVDVGQGYMERFCVTGSCRCPDGTGVYGSEIPHDGTFGLGLTTLDPDQVGSRFSVLSVEEACENLPGSEVLVVRFERPTQFEIHGGHCLVQDSGDLLIQAGGGRYPEGYEPPAEHRDDASMSIYKNPTSRADGGSVDLRIGGADLGGGSTIGITPDRLGGTFVLDSGYTGSWRCAALVTPEELWGEG